MQRVTTIFSSLLLSTLSIPIIGCGASTTEEKKSEPAVEKVEIISAAELKKTWVFRMSDDTQRAPFEGDAGWTAYFSRNYSDAMGTLSGDGLARFHVETAAVYRQAALIHANATKHIYGTDRQEEDSSDSLYLRGVGQILLGDTQAGLEDFSQLENAQLQSYASQWIAFVEKGESITPHYAQVPELKANAQFQLEAIPHFQIATTFENTMSDVTDATELWARSKWHEDLAKSLLPSSELVDLWLGPWKAPVEKQERIEFPQLSDSWLFLSPYLVAEDAYFIYDVQFDKIAALETWKEKSILAKIIASCMDMVDGKPKLNVEKVLDASSAIELRLVEEMKKATGQELPFYPLFADFAEQAILRAGVIIADANEQDRDAGKLRINANDLAFTNSKDPVFLISFAAWDVGNRYPLRAQKTIHRYEDDFPALKIAGQPLGSLQIRLGKSAVSGAAN